MGKITYILKPFDRNKAYQGALVVAIDKEYSIPENPEEATITNISYDDINKVWNKNKDFLGAGVAKSKNNSFVLTVSSVDYTFNSLGNGIGEAEHYILKMGEVATEVVSTGNGVTATTRSSTRREDTGDSTTVVDDTSYVYVDSLTPRDQFAMQALRGILAKVDDPSSVSTSVMSTYCDAAYQWAAQMMQAAANARSPLDDETATGDIQKVNVGSLETNTEKLLNNIVAALKDMNITGGIPDREDLPAYTANQIHDVLTYNDEGTVGYSTKSELYSALQSYIDARIRAWLQAMTIRVSTSHGTFDLTFDDTFVYTEEETATVIVNNPDQV
jgi:hypothetical protein